MLEDFAFLSSWLFLLLEVRLDKGMYTKAVL